MPLGGAALDLTGVPLPDETLSAAWQSDAVLLGAIGGKFSSTYKWDNNEKHLKPETGLLQLREVLKVFANLRPATVLPQLVDASTLKKEVAEGVDLMVVRELTGAIYLGKPRGFSSNQNGEEIGFNTEVYATKTRNSDLRPPALLAVTIGANVLVLRAEAAHVGQVLGHLDHIPEARLVAAAPTQFASAPRTGIAVLALAELLPRDALAALPAAAAAATPGVGLIAMVVRVGRSRGGPLPMMVIVELDDGDGGPVGGGGDDEEEGQVRCGDLEACPILCIFECLVETKITDHYD
ncbi:hypothetical protein NL676_026685 [Syzygium grande]|nr:hypothetical protein NL676_026685 [Syzygium grande]